MESRRRSTKGSFSRSQSFDSSSSSSSNDDDSTNDINNHHHVPASIFRNRTMPRHRRRMLASSMSSATAPPTGNPFDFPVDFSKVQKRRERARAAKEQAKEEAQKSLLQSMDATDATSEVETTTSKAQKQQSSQNRAHRSKVATRAKSARRGDTGQSKRHSRLGSFVHKDNGTTIEEDFEEPRNGQRKLGLWSSEDYDLVQAGDYEKLDDSSIGSVQEETQMPDDDPDESNDSNIPVFQRFLDPPDISTAIMGLPLTEFEATADERGIAIVSSWLFEAGLIDELLVNGGMTNSTIITTSTEQLQNTSGEGVEIGSHGFPIEGASKMDKEISKLRNSTRHQLSMINARLNDGVEATDSEVMELANLVIATKDHTGRLRELSSYVSNHESVEQNTEIMLTKYPKLQQTINARRNLARCLRQLDFFSQIPGTCDRLRAEMEACEWSEHECVTLLNVCREHVELEVFLVEAEAGLKKRLGDEDEREEQSPRRNRWHHRRRRNGHRFFDLKALSSAGLDKQTDELIDKFLSKHVQNVWELGDEIRMRIASGIATAFDLAVENPSGLVALVEAAEVYETANDEYNEAYGLEEGHQEHQTLYFTKMRTFALAQLYREFEQRGLGIYANLITLAADVADEEEAANQQFSAVLRAANELVSDISIVKGRMAVCFPPQWCIGILWTTSVAYVSSNNILQQIGGTEGHRLPDLTVTQLLDLVAWVETFREVVEEAFPNIASIASKRTYFDTAPQLLINGNKAIDLEAADDSLAWVNNMLWDIHDLSKDEFLFRTKEQTEEWLDNVYHAEQTKTQTAEGRLFTSLCEDVYSLAGVQIRTIRERLTRRSEAMIQAVGVIFRNLYEKQIATRDIFCKDFEECCAASNDFIRMSEKCEDLVNEINEECDLSPEASETLEEQAATLLGLYSGDAVFAAQKTHMYIFEPIEEAIVDTMFGEEWVDHMTHNEAALTIVSTLEDFLEDLEQFLDEVMVQKCVEAQVTASVNFYITVLLKKSSEHRSSRESYFVNNTKALSRIFGDIQIIREYFDDLCEDMPVIRRVIERDFAFLDAFVEVLSIAAGLSDSDIQDFVLVLQKTIKNFSITRLIVGDICHLVNPAEEHSVYEVIDSMEAEMSAIAPNDDKAVSVARNRMTVPGLRIDEILAKHIAQSTRRRPLQAGTLERAENALRKWRGR